MASKQIGPVTRAWYKWKALRLPWRKRFLMGSLTTFLSSLHDSFTYTPPGFDLQGNTYWEFRLTRGAESRERWRRIVQYPGSTHLSSVKVSPMWHQWLRHTREEPPTIEEQQGDVVRQARMKTLAAEADARWEAKPRVMEAPQAAPAPLLQSANAGSLGQDSKGVQADTSAKKIKDKAEKKDDPWAKAKAKAPGETWQPSAWTPPAAKKR
ncbi:hypothetical protein EDB82DRAFT_504811 [Fusarium venenatum]|uniref:uncharacterized protein n=1 Tax=Fusarium venenatum TaxID=56646 RepID=UPI001D4B1113|nr:hypothetical protein EDB82DRAFT_504811 [Fusarium venenatum]